MATRPQEDIDSDDGIDIEEFDPGWKDSGSG